MKPVLALVISLLLPILTFGASVVENAQKQAQECVTASMKRDWPTVVSYTHPTLVKMSGGKRALEQTLVKTYQELDKQGVVFEKVEVSMPGEPVKVGKNLIVHVPQTAILRINGKRIQSESVLIGLSSNDGKKWTFTDTVEMSEALYQQIFPDLQGLIPLPAKKDPIVLKAEASTPTPTPSPEAALSPEKTAAARDFFARYEKLQREFDTAAIDLYADTANIKNTRRMPDGTSRDMALTGAAYKTLLRQVLPTAKARGDTSKYSEVKYQAEGTGIRITATRYSELKKYSSPFSLLIKQQDSQWLIVGEASESKP
ncbi:MAG: hypothetical protein K0Q55_1227 [Verrucomicrobia bacterium]|jgi:hypothetical protein|nr:hypothetical protein [Verrucomicrobiota bacterium]